jgi:hypothetical protein
VQTHPTLSLIHLHTSTFSNRSANVCSPQGTPIGQLIEGNPKKLAGRKVDAEGNIWNDSGKVIGRAEPLPEAVEGELTAPFEDFPDAVVNAKGDVEFQGRVVGKVVEGDPKKLEGKKVASIFLLNLTYYGILLTGIAGRRRWRYP